MDLVAFPVADIHLIRSHLPSRGKFLQSLRTYLPFSAVSKGVANHVPYYFLAAMFPRLFEPEFLEVDETLLFRRIVHPNDTDSSSEVDIHDSPGISVTAYIPNL